MNETRFKIVFEKLSEITTDQALSMESVESQEMQHDVDEIAELRRIVLEVTEPPPVSYTLT